MRRYERDKQLVGERGHEVFLRGPDMILRCDNEGKRTERNFTPDEAVALLVWLDQHRDELSVATHERDN